ncbi:hypothetical protein PC111_g11594 [Phytophthora cactorum]|uniref:Uncharacterized protein n=1 Tax=Phytophthora cactorum TaxID=29920 RepID=A0A8T1C2L3_9STRA|nr:hypothetical protein PC111_g11594 [Phytophthora cactorum]KAG2844191.1 hypothetical protein PC112_g2281 [Phytophthora cactorum]KAG2899640.1 hypothetical protein PC114_g13855 [Phytophthora cactorum]KAG2913553.1 hypothetical protein PC115_g11980 [Phytophthora cactorum]KAG3094425.1 hypothetical protein PC121_g3013 [Phytophthora cactorum]
MPYARFQCVVVVLEQKPDLMAMAYEILTEVVVFGQDVTGGAIEWFITVHVLIHVPLACKVTKQRSSFPLREYSIK